MYANPIDKYRQNHFKGSGADIDTGDVSDLNSMHMESIHGLINSLMCSLLCILALVYTGVVSAYVIVPENVQPWSVQGIVVMSPALVMFVLAYGALVSKWEQ